MAKPICQECGRPILEPDPRKDYRNTKGWQETWSHRECVEKLLARDWHQEHQSLSDFRLGKESAYR